MSEIYKSTLLDEDMSDIDVSEKEFFPWTDDLVCGVRVIDMDHRELVGMINTLYRVIHEGDTTSTIGEVIERLIAYINEHFHREEQIMETYRYPDLKNHRKVHRNLARAVYAIRAIYEANPDAVDPDQILAFLKSWLHNHIMVTDRDYIPYLQNRDERQDEDVEGLVEERELNHTPEDITVRLEHDHAHLIIDAAHILNQKGPAAKELEHVIRKLYPEEAHKMTLEEAHQALKDLHKNHSFI